MLKDRKVVEIKLITALSSSQSVLISFAVFNGRNLSAGQGERVVQ